MLLPPMSPGEPEPTMSSSPAVARVRGWRDAHPHLAEAIVATAVLLANIPIGLSPLCEQPPAPAGPLWPLTAAACALCWLALVVRHRSPVAAWLGVTLTPLAFQAVVTGAVDLSPTERALVAYCLMGFTLIGVPICLVALAERFRAWWAWAACLASTATVLLSQALIAGLSGVSPEWVINPFGLVNVIGTMTGILLRSQQARLLQVELRSQRLALVREQDAQIAAANERSRIAREMHDIVAHSLAVMITMADGAAASLERNPAAARQALDVLAETGRSALADTRRLVGVLRDDPGATSAPAGDDAAAAGARPASLAPPSGTAEPAEQAPRTRRRAGQSPEAAPRPGAASPATTTGPVPVVRELPVPEFAPPGTVAPVEPSPPIAQLRRLATDDTVDTSTGSLPLAPAPEQADLAILVDRFRAAGVPLAYEWIGRPLPEDKGLQLTMFRIAQEALTNVLRYAPTTRGVGVHVERMTGNVILVVENEAAPGTTPMHGSGKGLIGMRERAAVYGGTVQAGPTPQGWRVRAVLRWDEDDEGSSPWETPR